MKRKTKRVHTQTYGNGANMRCGWEGAPVPTSRDAPPNARRHRAAFLSYPTVRPPVPIQETWV